MHSSLWLKHWSQFLTRFSQWALSSIDSDLHSSVHCWSHFSMPNSHTSSIYFLQSFLSRSLRWVLQFYIILFQCLSSLLEKISVIFMSISAYACCSIWCHAAVQDHSSELNWYEHVCNHFIHLCWSLSFFSNAARSSSNSRLCIRVIEHEESITHQSCKHCFMKESVRLKHQVL